MPEEKKEEKEGKIASANHPEEESKIQSLAIAYYSRQDIQKEIFNFCRKREVVPRYGEGFGKRPDTLEYPSDIIQQVKRGATSFHCSEELWQDPLEISTEFSREQLDNLREGWDLLIDIDSKYFDYSKIMARLIVKALNFHRVKNIGLKYSGNRGFHIIIPFKAFPKQVYEQDTEKMFPEFPRAVSLYLNEMIKQELIDEITKLTQNKSYIKDFESAEKVAPDIILVSSRHLFRCPYSLHEKTCLSSIVLKPNEIEKFSPRDADPLKVKVIPFMPEARENEARELLLQALDWYKSRREEKKPEKTRKNFEEVEIDKSRIVFPPCINKILQGMKDGKKRALFILLNYFFSLKFTQKETEEKIEKWNEKNEKPLKESYIQSQLSYAFKNKKVLPPNCDKAYYKDIQVCEPDELCKLIKNPVNYTIRKSRFKK